MRPVAVGETLRRIVSKVAMQAACVKDAMHSFLPSQCGVGVEGACETVAQGLQQFVRNHVSVDWALLQLDLSNAFNSLDRRAILDEVRHRVPLLFGWAQTCYASHSHLFVQGHLLSSQQGVQQGDPLGPFLFALTWQRLVRKLPSELLMNVWYLDDGHLVGDPEHLASALELVVQ